MMQRLTAAMLLSAFSLAVTSTQAIGADTPDKSWIEQSNVYTHMLLDVHLEHAPEEGSQQGLAKFDSRISNPTLADQLARTPGTRGGAREGHGRADDGEQQPRQGRSRDSPQGLRLAVSRRGLRTAARS